MAVKLGYTNVHRDPLGYPQWHAQNLPVDSAPAGLAQIAPGPTVDRPLQGWAMVWTLLGIFVGGIALNLTPCVYPLIPVTVSYFSGKTGPGKGSLIFHGAIFFIAGLFVVFTVVNRAPPPFEPAPPIERPKMKLQKPKVKVQKNTQPKPSSRIVAKVQTKQMPDIQLPDLEGAGDGLMSGAGTGGDGGFMDLPSIQDVTIFGGADSIGNDMRVSFQRTPIHVRAGITLVCVTDHIFRLTGRIAAAFPLAAGWEARATTAPQPRPLDFINYLFWLHVKECLDQRTVTAPHNIILNAGGINKGVILQDNSLLEFIKGHVTLVGDLFPRLRVLV